MSSEKPGDEPKNKRQRNEEDLEVKLKFRTAVFGKSLKILCDNLRPQNILITLESKGALTHNDVTRISAEVTNSDKVYRLIDIMLTSTLSTYDTFMDALKEERPDLHKHVIDISVRHFFDTDELTKGLRKLNPEEIKAIEDEFTQEQEVLQVESEAARAAAEAEAEAQAQEARLKKLIAGPWQMVNEIGRQDDTDGHSKLIKGTHVTVTPNLDVCIVDTDASKIKIYDLDGRFKSSIDTHSTPQKMVVSSDNTCFVIGQDPGSQGPCITMYQLDGKYVGSWKVSCPDSPEFARPYIRGLAIDHEGNLLLGDINNNYIYKYSRDGTQISRIKLDICPYFIAVTSTGTTVVAHTRCPGSEPPQVINSISSTGEVLYVLEHPPIQPLGVHDMYCHHGIIFFAIKSWFGFVPILCYTESGKYLGCIQFPEQKQMYPSGLAMIDNKTLLVMEYPAPVKVFKVLEL